MDVRYPWDSPDNLAWEDLRFPAQGINPAGAVTPPTVDTTTYPGTLLFPTNQVAIITGVAQMPHGWHLGSAVHPHIHWAKTTSAANAVVWEWCYAIAKVGGAFGAYSAWEACTYLIPDSDTENKHALAAWGYVDMTGYTESSVILWQIRRNVNAASDTYGADARLFEFDIHYQIARSGSATEVPTP